MLEASPSQFSIRNATEDDLEAILKIEKLSYPPPAIAWSRDAFVVELDKPFAQFLVLTDDETDSVIGAYIVYWQLFDETHILNVAVSPDWRGLGFATRLIRHAINSAVQKEMKRVFLEVRKSNAAAAALYQKLGFFIDHIKPSFYENGEDAYFMVLYLNRSNKF
jgi:ribosomal-protein-alanine N-acetyltransferase